MILDEIAADTRKRLAAVTDKEGMEREAFSSRKDRSFPFAQALSRPRLSFIAEVKKASPSKGLIAPQFDPVAIAREYERIGIDAVSVLTEPHFFQGSSRYLKQIAGSVALPLLRKDFVLDAYQIHQAKVLGASCVLLICALLDRQTLEAFISLCDCLGLDALVEAHDEVEIEKALACNARIIGINNRDLRTFKVDLATSARLRKYIPSDCLMVSESGYATRNDIKRAEDFGADAVLIGESFMRADDKQVLLANLRGQS
ncbi:MAG: indole-3-glycerol phosphate synthase TrpC [Spirochaetia bacterium]|nr:indole-3-glycerol phosphate synthase TrpC [Spirochaetia bacterium]